MRLDVSGYRYEKEASGCKQTLLVPQEGTSSTNIRLLRLNVSDYRFNVELSGCKYEVVGKRLQVGGCKYHDSNISCI